jgi:small subunit ribosomal protein S16
MVRIRLRRVGLKGQPSYRIVVINGRKARDGKYIEQIGHYNPRTEPATEVVQEERALYWMSVGAQPSEAVLRIFQHTGTMSRFERMRGGEPLEALAQEAVENAKPLPSPKTAYPAPEAGKSKLKAREAARNAAMQAQAAEAVAKDA